MTQYQINHAFQCGLFLLSSGVLVISIWIYLIWKLKTNQRINIPHIRDLSFSQQCCQDFEDVKLCPLVNSYGSDHTTWLACTVAVSVFLNLLNGCILQTVHYSVLSGYFAQLVCVKREKNTDLSKVPNTSNFLKRPPWTLWPCKWRHYNPFKLSEVKIPNTKFHNNRPGAILIVAFRNTEGRTDDETNSSFSELLKERAEKERKK